MKADRPEARFTDGADHVTRVPVTDYRYRNGGCCYRAAVDALLGRDFLETERTTHQ